MSGCTGFDVTSARWQSGDAAACKAVYTGSIPVLASSVSFLRPHHLSIVQCPNEGARSIAGIDPIAHIVEKILRSVGVLARVTLAGLARQLRMGGTLDDDEILVLARR
jgi:hypothetical protein